MPGCRCGLPLNRERRSKGGRLIPCGESLVDGEDAASRRRQWRLRRKVGAEVGSGRGRWRWIRKRRRDTSIVSLGVVSCGAVFFAIRGEDRKCALRPMSRESGRGMEAAESGVAKSTRRSCEDSHSGGDAEGTQFRHPLSDFAARGWLSGRSLARLRPGTREQPRLHGWEREREVTIWERFHVAFASP